MISTPVITGSAPGNVKPKGLYSRRKFLAKTSLEFFQDHKKQFRKKSRSKNLLGKKIEIVNFGRKFFQVLKLSPGNFLFKWLSLPCFPVCFPVYSLFPVKGVICNV
jgi:hypothetical protein